jgi:hypothetical protein
MYWIIVEFLHQQDDGRISVQAFKQYIQFYSSFEKGMFGDLGNIEQVLISS